MNTIFTREHIQRHQGQNRLLLIFSPSPIAGPATTQEEFLGADPQAVAERDLEMVLVDPTADELHTYYDIPEGSFAVVLIGKDGTVKMRSADPIPLHVLCQTIDAMPTRQREAGER